MAVRDLVYLPDQRLRTVCEPITQFDDDLQELIEDMFETMYEANGVGLAGNQIGICKRISVIDATEDKSGQLVLINPEIIERGNLETMQEGCLSVPGYYETVERAGKVKMKALDRHGKAYELEAEGLLAEAIQHEVDHLNGKVFIDLLSTLKRNRITKRFEKLAKQKSL